MKPPPLDYRRATSIDEAVALLAEHGDDAKVLAGGQSLIPMLNFRLARPTVLVDIGRVPDLHYIRRGDDGSLTIGALTTHNEVERAIADPAMRDFQVIARTAAYIGHRPIRTRGTIGGSLAHSDPASEWCILGVLLGAEVTIAGPAGTRTVPVEQLIQGFLTTDLSHDEIITSVRFPRPAPHAALLEFAPRHGDFAVVASSVWVELEGAKVSTASIVIGGVGSTPVRVTAAQQALVGARLDDATIEAAARAAAREVDPPADIHASSDYRRRLTGVLTRRALAEVRASTPEASR